PLRPRLPRPYPGASSRSPRRSWPNCRSRRCARYRRSIRPTPTATSAPVARGTTGRAVGRGLAPAAAPPTPNSTGAARTAKPPPHQDVPATVRSVDISDPAPSPLDFAAPAHTLLGARAAEFAGFNRTTAAGPPAHDRRTGRPVHQGQASAQPGTVPLPNPAEVAVARRADTALIQCWKPPRRWRDAGGNDPHTTT